jgi:hypothetical protein
MRTRHFIGIAAGLCTAPLFAHHDVRAVYSADSLVHLAGTVSDVQWVNPHVLFVLDTKDAAGNPVAWTVELGAPSALARRGFTQEFIEPGDELRIEVWAAKDGTPFADARAITFPDGTRIEIPESRWMQGTAELPPP